MRKVFLTFAIAAVFSLVFAGIAAADDQASPVVQGLETQFNVTAAQISALQAQGLGFGEIGIVFSIASKMTGGITDANVATIMGLRTGTPPEGWGQIAMSLTGTSLGKIVSAEASTKGVQESANAGSQGAAASGGHASGAGAGGRGGR